MGKVGGILVAIVIAVVIVGMQYSNKSEEADSTRVQVTELLQSLPDYEQAGPWYEGLADTHHEAAFEHAYKMGGKRTATTFDRMGYIHELLDNMAADADRQDQKERAGYLRELREAVYLESDGPA